MQEIDVTCEDDGSYEDGEVIDEYADVVESDEEKAVSDKEWTKRFLSHLADLESTATSRPASRESVELERLCQRLRGTVVEEDWRGCHWNDNERRHAMITFDRLYNEASERWDAMDTESKVQEGTDLLLEFSDEGGIEHLLKWHSKMASSDAFGTLAHKRNTATLTQKDKPDTTIEETRRGLQEFTKEVERTFVHGHKSMDIYRCIEKLALSFGCVVEGIAGSSMGESFRATLHVLCERTRQWRGILADDRFADPEDRMYRLLDAMERGLVALDDKSIVRDYETFCRETFAV